MATYSIKRGDTFAMRCAVAESAEVTSLTGWAITSQVRSQAGRLLSTLTLSNRDDTARTFVLTAPSTAGWPVGVVDWDIKCIDHAGNIRHSQTVEIPVVERETE